MIKKNYSKHNKSKKDKRSQTNYINNHHSRSLINIERLNAGEAFWFGLWVGSVGLLALLSLISDKSAKKTTDC